MFENFYNFFSANKPDIEFENAMKLIEFYQGKSFKDGLYRLHKTSDIEKWNEIVSEAFPEAKNLITCFGYDWLGRQFAVYKKTMTVLMFEPGTGYALDTEKTLDEFHLYEIEDENGAAVSYDYFCEWREKNSSEIKNNECVGYIKPLFLGGEDNVDNLEISDMEVYWGICGQLIRTIL